MSVASLSNALVGACRPTRRARGAVPDRLGARHYAVAECDWFEHPAAFQNLMVVSGSNERLAGSVTEHQRVEGSEQQTGAAGHWRSTRRGQAALRPPPAPGVPV